MLFVGAPIARALPPSRGLRIYGRIGRTGAKLYGTAASCFPVAPENPPSVSYTVSEDTDAGQVVKQALAEAGSPWRRQCVFRPG